jgi:hypothetical protein
MSEQEKSLLIRTYEEAISFCKNDQLLQILKDKLTLVKQGNYS